MGLFCGSVSAVINWNFLDGAQIAMRSETTELFASSVGIHLFWAYFIYIVILNIFDKGISAIVALIMLVIIPKDKLAEIERGSWKQKPLTMEEIAELKAWGDKNKHSMRDRATGTIIATSLLNPLMP